MAGNEQVGQCEVLLSVAKNPEHHGQMKYLDLCFYWLRDKVQSHVLQPLYLPTKDMPADLLTKALLRPQVVKLWSMRGLWWNNQHFLMAIVTLISLIINIYSFASLFEYFIGGLC